MPSLYLSVRLLLLAASQDVVYEKNIEAAHPAIRYWEAPLSDPVSRLSNRLENGSAKLTYADNGLSYLPSLLGALEISADSQVLVFSKTSLQRSKISPDIPRAIYFADDVAVGFVPGGDTIEMAAYDPRQGAVFYTLATGRSDPPRLERSRLCLSCHHDVATLGIPGMYVGSVQTSETGRPSYLGSIVSDHRTPFAERWGGWFVDGKIREPHRGNTAASGPQGEALASLLRKNDPDRYLEPSSDVVALMVLEHQTQMANYLIRLNWEARARLGPSAERLDEVARYMLFAEEAPFEGPISGASTFTETFARNGPRDSSGRSLRDLDLEHRLFRYPLSYMIESDLFAALPKSIRAELYRRIEDALVAPLNSDQSLATNRAILDILRQTLRDPDLPEAFGAVTRSRSH